MKNESKDKERLIKSIREDLDTIEFWRNNYIFEEELEIEKVREIDLAIGKVWLIYFNLTKQLRDKNKYP